MSTSVGYRDLDPRSLNSVAALLDQVQALTVDQNDEGALLVGSRFADQITMTQFYTTLFNATDPQLAANAPIIFASEVTLLLRTVMSRRASELFFRDMRDKFVPNPAAVYQQFLNAGWTPERIRDIITYFDATQLQAFLQYVGGQNFRLYGPVNVDEAMLILLPVTTNANLQSRQLFEMLYIPVMATLIQRGKVVVPYGPVYAFDPNSFVSESLRIADTTAEKQLVATMLTEQILHQLMNLELFVLPLNARPLIDALNTQYIVNNNPSSMGQGDGSVSTITVTPAGLDPIVIFLPTVLANNPGYATALTQAISTQSIGQNELDRVMILFNPVITRVALGVGYDRILNQNGAQSILTSLYNQLERLPTNQQRVNRLLELRNMFASNPTSSEFIIYDTLYRALPSTGPFPPNNLIVLQGIYNQLQSNQVTTELTQAILDLAAVNTNVNVLVNIASALNNIIGVQNKRDYIINQAQSVSDLNTRAIYLLLWASFSSQTLNQILVNQILGLLNVTQQSVSATLYNQLISQSAVNLAIVLAQILTQGTPTNFTANRAFVTTQSNNSSLPSGLRQTYTLFAQTFPGSFPPNNFLTLTQIYNRLGVSSVNQDTTNAILALASTNSNPNVLTSILSTLGEGPQYIPSNRSSIINQAQNTNLDANTRLIYILLWSTFFVTDPSTINQVLVNATLAYLGVTAAISPTLFNQLTSQSTANLTRVLSLIIINGGTTVSTRQTYVRNQATINSDPSLRTIFELYSQTFTGGPFPPNNLMVLQNIYTILGLNPNTVSQNITNRILALAGTSDILLGIQASLNAQGSSQAAQSFTQNQATTPYPNDLTVREIYEWLYSAFAPATNNVLVIEANPGGIYNLLGIQATIPGITTQLTALASNGQSPSNILSIIQQQLARLPDVTARQTFVRQQNNIYNVTNPNLNPNTGAIFTVLVTLIGGGPIIDQREQIVRTILPWLGVDPDTLRANQPTLYNNLINLTLSTLLQIQTQISTRSGFSSSDISGNRNFVNNQVASLQVGTELRQGYVLFQQSYTGQPTNQQILNQILVSLGVSDPNSLQNVPQYQQLLLYPTSVLLEIQSTLNSISTVSARITYVQQQAAMNPNGPYALLNVLIGGSPVVPTVNKQLLDQILVLLGLTPVQFGLSSYNAIVNSTDPSVTLTLQLILNLLQGGASTFSLFSSSSSSPQSQSTLVNSLQNLSYQTGTTGNYLVLQPLINAIQNQI